MKARAGTVLRVGTLVVMLLLTASAMCQADNVKLTMSTWQWIEPGFQDFWQALSKEFAEQNPGYEIEPFSLPKSSYFDQIIARTKAGNPPDIMMLDGITFNMIVGGNLEPLDPWLDKSDIRSRLQPIHSSFTYKGKTYVVCSMVAPGDLLLYNKALFAEAGLVAPLKTPEEFLAAARKLTKPGQYGFGVATKETPLEHLYTDFQSVWLWFGGWAAKAGRPTIDTKPFVEAAKIYKALVDGKITPLGMERPQLQQMFAEGKIAMIPAGPWVLGQTLGRNPAMREQLGCAFPPTALDPKHRTVRGAFNTLCIAKVSKYKEQAWKFIELLLHPKWQDKFVQMATCPPGTTGASLGAAEKDWPWLKTYLEACPYAVQWLPEGLEEETVRFQSVVNRELARVLYQNKDPEKAMADAQQELLSQLNLK